MTGSGVERRSGRPASEGGGREVLFEKSREEHRDTERDQPVECFGLTFRERRGASNPLSSAWPPAPNSG